MLSQKIQLLPPKKLVRTNFFYEIRFPLFVFYFSYQKDCPFRQPVYEITPLTFLKIISAIITYLFGDLGENMRDMRYPKVKATPMPAAEFFSGPVIAPINPSFAPSMAPFAKL